MADRHADGVSGGGESGDRERPTGRTVESVLVGDDLTLSYGPEPVVDCGRLTVPDGEVTALVGPNGSGKSTILKALSDQLTPDEGRVLLRGSDIASYDRQELARELGLLSQRNDAPAGITVEELVQHGRYPHRGFFESATADDDRAVQRALELTGIDHLEETELGELSGGQRQLAWIAMVLAQETDVLLLDEPTTFLDLHNQLRVLETVRHLNEAEGLTVVVVLHDVARAARVADYLVALDDGRLYDRGPPAEVVTEELLADVFAVDAVVEHGPETRVLPRRSLSEE